MSVAQWAPIPVCPEHGQMRRKPPWTEWTCAGWDGEGCEHTVADADLAWQPLGELDAATLGLELPRGLRLR